jgi:hypothetical protein
MRRIRGATTMITACVVVALASCSVSTSASSPTTTQAQRVAHAFAKMSVDVAKKDGFTSAWSTPKLADRTSLPDGEKVSLWVTSDVTKGLPTFGYYIDMIRNKPKGASGISSWGQVSEGVFLESGMPPVVVGNVGFSSAVGVRVSVDGRSANLPVTQGYFLVPWRLTTNTSAKFTITLLDQWGKPFGTVSDLSLVGGRAPAIGATAIPKPVSDLPDCMASAVSTWPVEAVTEGVPAAVYAYFKAKNLLPITIYKNSENVLDPVQQRLGWHSCSNGNSSIGGYAGSVPMSATKAVMVYVHHAPYPIVESSDSFVTLAMMPGKGWQVVGEGTGP